MVDVYLSVSDVELATGVTYTASTNPTLTQLQDYITRAEAQFETEVGVYKEQTITNEIVDGEWFGCKVSGFPLTVITQIIPNSGTEFELDWTGSALSASEYYIKTADISKIKIVNPQVGNRKYKVDYQSGYAYASMPQTIKDLVLLYTMNFVFENTLFNTSGNISGKTEIIDVDVYREITNGGSAYEGTKALRQIIEDKKGRLLKGRVKAFYK